MAILKNGSYAAENISKIDLNNVNLNQDDNLDMVKFDKNEYLNILEKAKSDGYADGLAKGYNDGYAKSLETFEEDKIGLQLSLERDKEALSDYLNAQSLLYINTFKDELKGLLLSSLDKLFLKALNSEEIMSIYICNLVDYISKNYKNFIFKANDFTINHIEQNLKNINIDIEIDNSLSNFDFLIDVQDEFIEFFFQDEFDKIKKLFS